MESNASGLEEQKGSVWEAEMKKKGSEGEVMVKE